MLRRDREDRYRQALLKRWERKLSDAIIELGGVYISDDKNKEILNKSFGLVHQALVEVREEID